MKTLVAIYELSSSKSLMVYLASPLPLQNAQTSSTSTLKAPKFRTIRYPGCARTQLRWSCGTLRLFSVQVYTSAMRLRVLSSRMLTKELLAIVMQVQLQVLERATSWSTHRKSAGISTLKLFRKTGH